MPGKTTKKSVQPSAPAPARGRKKAVKESDYLIALLVDGAGIYASWKISDDLYGKILRKALTDYHGDPYLFLQVTALDTRGPGEIEDIPVYGRENRWHIFTTGAMAGRRVVLRLSYQTSKGKREAVLQSTELDIPLGDAALVALLSRPLLHDERRARLYEASGIREQLDATSPSASSP